MKKQILTLALLGLGIGAMAQKKPKTYNIKYADTVNVYNDKTVLIIKTVKGGKKYITVRPQDTYILKEANVVNYYADKQTVQIDTIINKTIK